MLLLFLLLFYLKPFHTFTTGLFKNFVSIDFPLVILMGSSLWCIVGLLMSESWEDFLFPKLWKRFFFNLPLTFFFQKSFEKCMFCYLSTWTHITNQGTDFCHVNYQLCCSIWSHRTYYSSVIEDPFKALYFYHSNTIEGNKRIYI